MSAARIRPLLAAIAVAAVLVYGLAGHGSPQMSHEGMAGAGVGLCLLVLSLLTYAAVSRLEARASTVPVDRTPIPLAAPALLPLDARARASPPVLQRFRN